jgi:teichuronic acid exporter
MPPEVAPGVVEHPEIDTGPTAHAELETHEVRRLAYRGFGVLLARSLAQRGLQMAGNILLARWLAPKTFGLYAVVSFLVGFAGFLSDLGVGAALVQRRQRLREKDLETAFTLSLAFNAVAIVALWSIAPLLVRAYQHPGSLGAVRAMTLTILLGTFSAIPSVVLERRLQFKTLAIADLLGQVAYLGIALSMAIRYWKQPALAELEAVHAVWIFVYAAVASRAVHAIVVNFRSPWRPRLRFDWNDSKELLRFGLPYQLNGFVNSMKDNFIPIFIALVVGATQTGYVVWAVGLVTNALLFMPIVSRVAFPAFSRLQHDRAAFGVAVESAIKLVAITVIPAAFFLAAFARQIVEHVYVPKWAPGLPSVYLLCIPMINSAYSTVCVSALYGLGRAKTVLRLTLVWAAAGWALGVPLTLMMGMHGFALAMSVVSWLSFMAVRALSKEVRISFVPAMLRISLVAAIPAGICALLSGPLVRNAWQLAALAIAGGAAYLVGLKMTGDIDVITSMLRRRRPATSPSVVVQEVAAEHA